MPLVLLLAGCTAVPAATESYKVITHLRDGNVDRLAGLAQGYAKDAFARLVVTS